MTLLTPDKFFNRDALIHLAILLQNVLVHLARALPATGALLENPWSPNFTIGGFGISDISVSY